jgi:ElaA protein
VDPVEHEKAFADLTPWELYAILELRQRVFAVEQTCAYLDCDGHDQAALHLWTTDAEGMIAYTRVLPPGEKFKEASLGRVATAMRARRMGAGRAIVKRALETIERHGYGATRISAQSYLEKFYGELGFVRVGAEYLEDDIPHIEMLRDKVASQ